MPINIYGPGSASGTHDFFAEALSPLGIFLKSWVGISHPASPNKLRRGNAQPSEHSRRRWAQVAQGAILNSLGEGAVSSLSLVLLCSIVQPLTAWLPLCPTLGRFKLHEACTPLIPSRKLQDSDSGVHKRLAKTMRSLGLDASALEPCPQIFWWHRWCCARAALKAKQAFWPQVVRERMFGAFILRFIMRVLGASLMGGSISSSYSSCSGFAGL